MTFYDAVAEDYDDHFRDTLAGRPLERGLLAAFAEHVRTAPGSDPARPVLDAGCGPGRVTGHLAGLGLPVHGIDLSPAMVALARRTHPGLRFEVGSLARLPAADASLGGLLAWYSVIHTPEERLPDVFAEFHRVLAPGAPLLAAFQAGDEPLHVAEPFGHPVSLDFRRRQPDHVAGMLARAGLPVRARAWRESDPARGDTAPQAFLLAHRPPDAARPAPGAGVSPSAQGG